MVLPSSREFGIARSLIAGYSDHFGELAVVTSASGEARFRLALKLALAGMDVIIASSRGSGDHESVKSIRSVARFSLVKHEELDLARLSSITSFVRRLEALGRPVDLLINNHELLSLLPRGVTPDGFELQFANNFLGHFALTAQMLPLLRGSRTPRVFHEVREPKGPSRFDVEDLQSERSYSPVRAYERSKFALLLFAMELQRRSEVYGWGVLSRPIIPLRQKPVHNPVSAKMVQLIERMKRSILTSSQSGSAVILPTRDKHMQETKDQQLQSWLELYALVDPKGSPWAEKVSSEPMAQNLWEKATQLTGITWPESNQSVSLESFL